MNKYDKHFWDYLDKLFKESELIIDRPKGSSHPKFKDLIYPVDYGYLKNTKSMDGNGIDVWFGSSNDNRIGSIICTVDLLKKDSEIKILYSCTEQEKLIIYQLMNEKYMKALFIERKA